MPGSTAYGIAAPSAGAAKRPALVLAADGPPAALPHAALLRPPAPHNPPEWSRRFPAPRCSDPTPLPKASPADCTPVRRSGGRPESVHWRVRTLLTARQCVGDHPLAGGQRIWPITTALVLGSQCLYPVGTRGGVRRHGLGQSS